MTILQSIRSVSAQFATISTCSRTVIRSGNLEDHLLGIAVGGNRHMQADNYELTTVGVNSSASAWQSAGTIIFAVHVIQFSYVDLNWQYVNPQILCHHVGANDNCQLVNWVPSHRSILLALNLRTKDPWQ